MEEKILQTAVEIQKQAHEVIKELRIVESWESIGAKVNLVGSLRTGLLIKNRDIDFHVYTDNFSIEESFKAIGKIASNPRTKRISYTNLVDTEEKCLEWHLWYDDKNGDEWQIDIIHILNDSKYAGRFEMVADRIAAVLTPETRFAILSIKYAIPGIKTIMGIEVYQAVIRDGIRNYDDFVIWRKNNEQSGIIEWMP
ncbi:MAG TPA: nucleotidyltransferase domain-containing protein [bacterium]|nr:nucleotidyltransferase domain-containing protein [bacterium]HPS31489.1 nucleotidyltransferase domain-containing protein [bacterium]